MKRWLVVFTVVLLTTFMVWGAFRNPALSQSNATVPSDELLAYDLTPPHSAVIGLIPKSDEFRLTTWCIVGKATPDERFDYVVRGQWLTPQNQVLGENQFAFQSRVSTQAESREASAWATRLAYSSDAVTDSRTVRIKLPTFSGQRPAKVRLLLPTQKNDRVIIRTTFPEPRLPLEIRAAHEGLSAQERRTLVENVASVSYDELPWQLQAQALSSWQRRLDAAGVEGKDFFVTRLLVGTGRATAGLVTAQRRLWFVDRTHALAYNVKAPVDVELTTKPGSRIFITQLSDTATRSIPIGESGRVSLQLGQNRLPQTVIISSEATEPTALQLTITEQDLPSTLGNVSRLTNDTHYELLPMIRRSDYYALNEAEPITVSIPEGQRFLGLRIRANAGHPVGWVEARFGAERPRTTVALIPSQFEQWSDNSQATDPRILYLQLPQEVREVTLYGSTTLAASPFTIDPDVQLDRLAEPFDLPLDPQQRWLYPRYDLAREVPIRPSNLTPLTALNRKIELLSQSRLVSTASDAPLPDTLLVPQGRTVQRHLLEPYRPVANLPVPDDLVIALEQPRQFVVPSAGARAGRVRIAYRLAPANVGSSLDWILDGQSWRKETTLTQAEERELTLPPGRHSLELVGLTTTDRALVEALPVGADGALRRRVTYRLEPSGRLTFAFDKRVPKAKLLIFLFAEHERLFKFDWALTKTARTAFTDSLTASAKVVETLAVAAPQTWFWETRDHGPLYRHRERILLGDDVAQGAVVLTLHSQLRTTAYVYCVLVGQAIDEPLRVQRFWTQEEPE